MTGLLNTMVVKAQMRWCPCWFWNQYNLLYTILYHPDLGQLGMAYVLFIFKMV